MKLLILGGTVFLGRHIVTAALTRGHEVTLFNRGQHNPDLFPDVEKLYGDRDGGLSVLAGRQWDAAIDTCGFVPRIVRASAEVLKNAVNHYTFISSISVYAGFDVPDLNEQAPLATLEDETVEQVTNETYGPLKALCEQAVEQVMPGRALIVRPGLIVGPDDPTDRFTYWPVRIARGGEMLAPGRPEPPVQFIDVRDLAEWIVRMVEARKTGVYNATGPDYILSWDQFLDTCKEATGSDTQFTWVSEAFLMALKEEPSLQPWVPDEYTGINSANCHKAFADSLTFRPLATTIRDTLDWKNASPTRDTLKSGFTPEQEQQLLRDWEHTAKETGR